LLKQIHEMFFLSLNTPSYKEKDKYMADIADRPTLLPFRDAELIHTRQAPQLWHRIALGAILLLSIAMNFFLLGLNGYGNLYYASGVRSMTDSWHNFFFVSFDPGGFVTIDKPPLGFWLQALSAKIFGFTPFSIFLPQAICGVLAVLLLYSLVRRHFGAVAGLVTALALAVTPISVVTDRNNTIDGTLALALLLAAWAVIRAAETGKLRWLLLSAAFVGIGFNIKMSEAYLVVPALGMTYLLCAPRKIWTRTWHLALALVVMLVISLSWAAAVDLTPASQRPWVGSTQDNSELSLAFGYNGLNRLHIGSLNGRGNRPGATQRNTATTTDTSARSGTATAQNNGATTTNNAASATDQSPLLQDRNSRNTANRVQQFPGGGAFGTGATGPFRLFSASLGGQIAWLLPFALLAIVASAWQRRPNFQEDRQQLGLILWGVWLLTMAAFFTLDGNFHQYYMTEMAPGLSALVGIGVVTMWQDYRSPGWHGWLLPIALVATAAAQIYMLLSYPAYERWLSPLIGILTALVVLTLVFFRLRLRLRLTTSTFRLANLVMGIGLFALLVAPAVWAGYSVIHNTENSFPTAGPGAQGNFGGFLTTNRNNQGTNLRANRQNDTTRTRTTGQNAIAGQFGAFGGDTVQTNAALISYLEAHQGHTRFLVATPSSNMADSIILTTNKPVMAMGGFSGGDPILTTSSLQNLIQNGTVRFFLINAPRTNQGQFAGPGGFGRNGQNAALTTWISNHCTAVPTSAWQSATGTSSRSPGGNQLYDCASPRS
jgi:4-amino-4-deoxy-L-arabinose transferase-like glycosyltransferase